MLIDLDGDRISPLEEPSSGILRKIPVRDSVMAIADETYFDWNVLPEIPGPLRVEVHANAARLTWKPAQDAAHIVIERRTAPPKVWAEIKTVPANSTSYEDMELARLTRAAYRIRAANSSGKSGYSNVVTVEFGGVAGRGR